MRLDHRIEQWSLKKKISFFMSVTILITSLIILVVSTLSAAYYMTKQSKEMAREQLDTLASNYADTLKQYQNLAISLVINDEVQSYCKNTDSMGPEYEKVAGDVYNYLLNMLNVQSNLNFVLVLKENTNNYVYKGTTSVVDARFDLVYKKDYEQSSPIKSGSTVTISFGNQYFRDGKYTLTMYHPIYNTNAITEPKGMLVMNLSDSMLQQLHTSGGQDGDSDLSLTDWNGVILSSAEEDKIGTEVPYKQRLDKVSGSFQEHGVLINYQRVGNWNYYLINETPVFELYKGSLGIMGILLVVILAMTACALLALRRIMNSFYEPLNRVVRVMDDVAEGRLDVRIDAKSMDTDSRKLAEGFNLMMDKIDVLMEQVKMEQHQMEQIRFNALHSQIKPHFLYNTLECIHWQAVVDGNQEISTMVKAMAQYYRICLSRGKEMITLREELKHIRSYLIIQNMRYDNIISLEDHIPESFYTLKIPKMTLQPLIENAIYHGIRIKEGEKGTVALRIRAEGPDAFLLVEDSGTGMSRQKIEEMNQSISQYDENFGYGVRNVNKRIELMFGPEYGLRFFLNETGGVSVEIHLPMEAQTEDKGVI